MPTLREVIDEHFGEPHGAALIEAAQNAGYEMDLNEEGRLDIADAIALVWHESDRGYNQFGYDWGNEHEDEVPFAHLPVTRERVQTLLAAIEDGYDSNGVGLTQLTYPPLIYRAENLGGAHIPENQLKVGFEHLADLVGKLGYGYGIAAYNAGEGNAQVGIDNGYYDKIQDARAEVKEWLADVDEGDKVGEPDEPEEEYTELVTTHNQWVYDAKTQAWVVADQSLRGATLVVTDSDPAWIYSEAPAIPPVIDPGRAPDSLEDRIAKVSEYFWALVSSGAQYFWWYEGVLLNTDGPPAWAVDDYPPAPEDVYQVFCAGLGNLALRLLGMPVPKHSSYSGYDGGTGAWKQNYWQKMYWYDNATPEPGDVAFRPFMWNGSQADQGHWAWVDYDGVCLQSFAYSGATLEPGANGDYTIEESHDGGYYVALLKAEDWLL